MNNLEEKAKNNRDPIIELPPPKQLAREVSETANERVERYRNKTVHQPFRGRISKSLDMFDQK